ncbi:tryptophan-rich sensory protein [Shimazuella sp. AN120528]|uniref:TspO/MBR family protein n=1 Tax=Shimazuella soli TaxID=1892854 RepID=UPI001F0F0029|nr:tryptophan-rich sensory protein [Shimazuella soli]
MKERRHAILSFSVFLSICFSVALIGALMTEIGENSWFTGLQKPTFQPPNWIFGPVWTVLYILIAISGWLVYIQERTPIRKFVLQVYAAQLILNLLWTFLFFGLHSLILSLVDIFILVFTIFYYIVISRNLSKWAALLFVPYAIWVTFAALLNLSLWMLNPV